MNGASRFFRSKQGGGSGVGFQEPGSLLYDEPKMFRETCRKIVSRISNDLNKCVDDSEKKQIQVRNREIKRRVYKLDSMKKLNDTSSRMYSIVKGTVNKSEQVRSRIQNP